jgi:hypothetical protein
MCMYDYEYVYLYYYVYPCTVGADETEQSLNPNNILFVRAIALQFFSVCNYKSLDAYYKISLT